MQSSANKPIVAAFDFDGTLTQHDTLPRFLLHVLGYAALARHTLALSPILAGYSLGVIGNDVAKEKVLVRCLGGMTMDELRQQGESFAARVLPDLLRPEAMQRVKWHQQQGHRCVIVSASLELYVRPWAIKAGFDEVIASQLETQQDGRTTGRLHGANCFGIEKVNRLDRLLGSRQSYTVHAYGDSRGDKELLASADYAYYRFIPTQRNP